MKTEMITASERMLARLKSNTESKLCQHCKGCGECWCGECTSSWPVTSGDFRDEFDTGRQGEGTCTKCNGFGVVDMEGKPIIEETHVEDMV